MENQEYVCIEEIAKYLGIRTKTIYSFVESGKIPHYRIGRLIRFKKDEIDIWMEGNRAGHEEHRSESAAKRAGRPRRNPVTDIDRLIRKNIDQAKRETYNVGHGKPDQIKGLGKEV